MAAKLEKLEGNKAKLELLVPADKFEEGIAKAYQKLKGKFNIPGFRKGKAPRKMVENFYGPQVFYEDALDEIIPQAYLDAVKEHELDVVSRPDYDVLSIDQKEGVVVTATVVLKPVVKLGKYEGIKVRKPVEKITAKEVDAEIGKTREQNARWVEVERASKNGDTVLIDFVGSIDGVKFEGGAAEDQTLVLGEGRFIPGFEEQIIGMKAGDEKDIDVKFPEDYTPEFAGKDAVFAITMKAVKEKELPELDDDFAQDVSEFDTLADYKKDVKKKLQERADLRAKAEMENQLLETVAKGIKVDIPDVMVDDQIDYQIQQMSYQLMYQGMKLDDYLNYMGKTLQDLRNDYKESAQEQVRMRLAVEALLKKLEIDPTEEDIEKKYEQLAKEANKTVQEFKDTMSAQEIDYFKERVAMEQLFDYLVSKAEIEEFDPKKEAEKPAEKKAASKESAKKEPAKDSTKKAAKKTAESAGKPKAAKE
ncbi:trigger factor [Christensenella tenuis]|uniref:Trigger factor n=1 Tax=Christensenella tenuis TaxID=2763033 RepID=A0ABR7ECH2_9FIRM|nr:trigger factor [Christensenella tenuis]MBC5647046.1 trigger factor [Christensenella tenuis]